MGKSLFRIIAREGKSVKRVISAGRSRALGEPVVLDRLIRRVGFTTKRGRRTRNVDGALQECPVSSVESAKWKN